MTGATVTIEEEQVEQQPNYRNTNRRGLGRVQSDDDLADSDFFDVELSASATRQFDAIEDLPHGWDSHGGDAPDPGIVDSARSLLRSLAEAGEWPKPHINPTPSGGVQLEWEDGSQYLELEVVGEGSATFFFQDKCAGNEEEGEVFYDGSLDEVVEHLNSMFPG